MRISDWSSDVCSSDLIVDRPVVLVVALANTREHLDDIVEIQPIEQIDPFVVDLRRRRQRAVFEPRIGDEDRIGEILVEEGTDIRSEEHTSELQSLMRISYAVFCLKKKTKKETNMMRPQ